MLWRWLLIEPLDRHVVIPLIVKEIPSVVLDFAHLKIRRLRTQRLLWRNELPAPVEVDDGAIAVLVADVEVGDPRIVRLLHPVARIARQPAPRRDIHFRPVVIRVSGALGFPTTLPPRRHAGRATHGDEQRALDSAVALVARETGQREARDRAVFLL